MKTLITGVKSGIGRYLHKKMGGEVYVRNTTEKEYKAMQLNGFEVIIHCASKTPKPNAPNSGLYEYIRDNILLTEKILNIPHKKFIHFSTVEVYPKNDKTHKEEEKLYISKMESEYAITKYMSELLVKELGEQYLILRCVNILGEYSRKTNTIRLIENESPDLTISDESEINFVGYEDIYKAIIYSLSNNVGGVYNIASDNVVRFGDIASMIKKKVKFGEYVYNSGKIDNTKINKIIPKFSQNSRKVVEKFIENKI